MEAKELDADFRRAESYFEEGRIGSAADLYKSLYSRGDYRGIEGLRRIEGTKPQWKDYINFVIKSFEERRRPIRATMAMYPHGFSFSRLIESMEEQFGDVEDCRHMLDAMRTADWGHPYNAFVTISRASDIAGINDARNILLEAVGSEIGMDKNTVEQLTAYKRQQR